MAVILSRERWVNEMLVKLSSPAVTWSKLYFLISHSVLQWLKYNNDQIWKLVQLECLHSENTPRHPTITHTIDSYQIPDQSKQDKVKVTNFKNLPKISVLEFCKIFTHNTPFEVAYKMCKYDMNPPSIVEVTERTRFCPQTDGETDRRTYRQTDGWRERGGIIKKTYFPLASNYNTLVVSNLEKIYDIIMQQSVSGYTEFLALPETI